MRVTCHSTQALTDEGYGRNAPTHNLIFRNKIKIKTAFAGNSSFSPLVTLPSQTPPPILNFSGTYMIHTLSLCGTNNLIRATAKMFDFLLYTIQIQKT